MRLSFGYFDSQQTGQLMSRATVDIQAVRFFLGYGLIFFFQHIFTVIGVTILVFVINWKLALIALFFSPVMIAIAYHYSNVSHPVLRDVQQKMADVATVAEENVVGVHVVKSFAQEQAEQDKFERRTEVLFGQSVVANRQRAFYVPLLSFLPILGQAAVLFAGGHMVVSGSMSSGQFVAFNLYLAMLIWPLRMLGMWIGEGQRATASGERIFQVIDEPEDIRDAPDAIELPAGDGRVRFEGVTFGYAADRPLFSGLDLELEPGRTVALIGHTGSGKTSLASLIPRFYDVQAGRVTIDGADVRDADAELAAARDRRDRAGPVPVLGDGAREPRVRPARGDRRGDRDGRAARAGARVHRPAAGGIRHGDRRARHHAVGRAAAARRDRARPRRRPAHPDPRRRDRLGRRDDGGEDPRRPAGGDEGPDDRDHRPPPLDDRPCGRDRRPRSRPHRRARHARRPDRRQRGLHRDLRARPPRARGRPEQEAEAV